MNAEQESNQGHYQKACQLHAGCSGYHEHNHESQRNHQGSDVEKIVSREHQRLGLENSQLKGAVELAVGHYGTGEGHRADKHAQKDFNEVHYLLGS